MRAADLHRLARDVRDMALVATRNVGADAVTGGQLAVVEDVARHPDSTVGEITARTGLAQSLVSRVVQQLVDAGVMRARGDPADRRKRLLAMDAGADGLMRERGAGGVDEAVTAATPALTRAEREELQHHLERAAALLDRGRATPGVRTPGSLTEPRRG